VDVLLNEFCFPLSEYARCLYICKEEIHKLTKSRCRERSTPIANVNLKMQTLYPSMWKRHVVQRPSELVPGERKTVA
jgi:hypothetical protein